jgi:N-acetyl-beta-hexosaminidase
MVERGWTRSTSCMPISSRAAARSWRATAWPSPAGKRRRCREDGRWRRLPNPAFAGPGFKVYAWNNAWGSGMEDMAYRLANAGYEVVLANAANLYFDLAYAKDPQEPGYYWAGFVETRHAFAFCPAGHARQRGQRPDGPRWRRHAWPRWRA